MGLHAPDGTPLTASAVQALTTAVTQPAKVTVTSPIWETYVPMSRTSKIHRRVKWAPGDVVLQSDIDAFFAGGTGPTITSVSPTTVAAAGGTKVTLVGTNLERTTGVTLGGTACTAVTLVSPTKITFVTPAKAANAAVPIVVNGPPANSAAKNVIVA